MWRILKANLNAKSLLSNFVWLIVLFIFLSQNTKGNAGQMILIGVLAFTILYWWAPGAFQTQHFPAIRLPITLSQLAITRLCYVPAATLLLFIGTLICSYFFMTQDKLISLGISYIIYLCILPTINACGLIAQDLQFTIHNAKGRWLSFLSLSIFSFVLFACTIVVVVESDPSRHTWLIDLAVEPLVIFAIAITNILSSWLSISTYRKRRIYLSSRGS